MLERRPWVPAPCEDLVQAIAADTAQRDSEATFHEIARLVGENRRIHDLHGINLNPASNVMNPRAEAMMAAGLGSRASLGYPGDKYEMGLEAIERIEVICAELAAEVFGAKYAEVRVASGALANLYVFMATCKPGDTIIAPPAEIGGHVTHHAAGAVPPGGRGHLPVFDAGPIRLDVRGVRAVLIAERLNDGLLRHLLGDGGPRGRVLVLLLD